ncbi:MAG: metallophosphoesterase [Opitutales bacterium]
MIPDETPPTDTAASFVPVDFHALARRFGRERLARRLRIQAEHTAKGPGQGKGFLRLESRINIYDLLRFALRVSGQLERGRRNFLDIRVEHNRLPVRGLPPAFEGFRLLQISDLHADIRPDLADAVIRVVQGLPVDHAVFTGDFRNGTFADYADGVRASLRVRRAIDAPAHGVLGNHDFIEMVPGLEAGDLAMLLNEVAVLERDGQRLALTGIDDAHFYRTDDLPGTLAGVPAGVPVLLLSHAPEIYAEAASHDVPAMLCGHTHAGQICLPGGWAPIRNGNFPRQLVKGSWRIGDLHGYTSRGTGGCAVDVRFNCPPEVTIHTLLGT